MRRRMQAVVMEAIARERARATLEKAFVGPAVREAAQQARAALQTGGNARQLAKELTHLTNTVLAAQRLVKRGAGVYAYGSRLTKTERLKRQAEVAAAVEQRQVGGWGCDCDGQEEGLVGWWGVCAPVPRSPYAPAGRSCVPRSGVHCGVGRVRGVGDKG